MGPITTEMENALRFYGGDVTWWEGLPSESAFWKDTKAYGTLNALFFEGLTNEQARIAENKFLNPVFLENPERLLTLCKQLIDAMCLSPCPTGELHTFRVERLANFRDMVQAGQTISFTSTSKADFLNEYKDKKNLVLLDFHIGAGIPYADMQQLLSQYLKSNEQEVLLPPFLPLSFAPRALTAEEQKIRDYNEQPPVAAYDVIVGLPSSKRPPVLSFPPTGAEAGKRVLQSLKNFHTPNGEDVALYCAWKQAFRSQVRNRCEF